MPPRTTRELFVRKNYETDKVEVWRRVRKDLGAGSMTVTSETREHPDIDVFLEEQPDARISNWDDAEPESDDVDPADFTLDELEGIVANIDSVDALLRMRQADTRKTSDALYEDRIADILSQEDETEEEETEDEEE